MTWSCPVSIASALRSIQRVNSCYPTFLDWGLELAHNIIEYRREHGPFTSRKGLKEVPRLGPKAFELAAGFLRIHDGENPLDASAVHPERYALVSKMAKDLDVEVGQLLRRDDLRRRIDLTRYASDEVGLPTARTYFPNCQSQDEIPAKSLVPLLLLRALKKWKISNRV